MDINIIRQDTLGCTNKLFLDSAGCALPPKIVLEKMTAYQQQEEQIGGYELARQQANVLQTLYSELAQLLHCKPQNVAYAYNATDAFNKAMSAIPFVAGDCILTTDDDYISNHITFLSMQKRLGIKLIRAKNTDNGDLDLLDFEQLIQIHKPVLVAITHIPTNSGLIQDAEAIGQICKKYKVWYLLDACQSVGQRDVDVQKIGCDFLNATGRKFLRGPRSTGFLYVSDRVLEAGLEPLFIDRRGATWTSIEGYEPKTDATRFEINEISASVIGLTEALRYANQVGIEQIETRNQQLMARLRANLTENRKIQLLDKGSELCNILTFSVKSKDLTAVNDYLKRHEVYFSVAHKNYALIDFAKKNVDWAIRLSPHYYNTFEEIDKISEILENI